MEKVLAFLQENPVQYLATIGRVQGKVPPVHVLR